jgi:membrane-associated phospholipid phosphatase
VYGVHHAVDVLAGLTVATIAAIIGYRLTRASLRRTSAFAAMRNPRGSFAWLAHNAAACPPLRSSSGLRTQS